MYPRRAAALGIAVARENIVRVGFDGAMGARLGARPWMQHLHVGKALASLTTEYVPPAADLKPLPDTDPHLKVA